MNKVVALLGICGLLGTPAVMAAATAPRGSVLELHSCELYAGGCIVSSEATQGGRYMVRAFTFSDGVYGGTSFAGLTCAVLEESPDNLADLESKASTSVVYLPQTASAEQRAALLSWLKATQPTLSDAKLQTRVVPVAWTSTSKGYQLSAGNYLSVRTAGIESCPTGACGEALWYSPRTASGPFAVAVNAGSAVAEPLLQLKWKDAGKKSVFLARFGDKKASSQVFLTMTDLCGPAGKLF